MVRRLALAAICAVSLLGCATTRGPELRVLGSHEAARTDILFVQVTNPANRPMRLTKLEYTFASAGATVSGGEIPLAREVPAHAVVVVEVPLAAAAAGALTLRGKLTAELDQIVRIFTVSTQLQPAPGAPRR